MQPHNNAPLLEPGGVAERAADDEIASHADASHVPVHAAAGTGRRLGLIVLLLVLALGAGFLIRRHERNGAEMSLARETNNSADAPAAVDVVRAAYASPDHVLSLPGETRAWYESTIYARVSGYVDKWTRDIGDRVHKGDELAVIDTPELDDQLAAARAKARATDAEIRVASTNHDFAQKQFDRWTKSPRGVVSPVEQEEKEAAFYSSEAKLTAAQAQAKLDEAEVKRLEDLSRFRTVVAPFDGTITGRKIDVGDLVTAGSTANTTSLFQIAKADTIRVFTDVPQSAALEIHDGMAATVVAREFPGRPFDGKVARTSRSIDPTAKTLTVEVDVKNEDLALLPGMYVEVSFKTNEAKPPLRIPASALTFRSGGPQVAVVAADGTVTFHDVSIARDLGDSIEIGSGLAAGDQVALNISNQVANGDRVVANEVSADGGPAPAVHPPAVASRTN